MITEASVLVIALLVFAAVVLGFLLLNRKIDTLLRRSSSSSSSTASEGTGKDDFVIFLKFTSAVIILAVAVIFAPSMADVYAAGEAWGLFADSTPQQPLGVWVSNDTGLGRYQWQPFDLANKTRYPVIECAVYTNAEDLHLHILGDLPNVEYNNMLDPSLQKEKAENRRREERLRAKARSRCVLNPEAELITLNSDHMNHLSGPNQPSLIDVVRENALGPDALALRQSVDHVLVARDGSRFYRVAIVVKNTTAKKGVSLEHRLVEERDLLVAPRTWYRKFCDIKAFSVYPCVCPSHFGIINSGFYFQQDTSIGGVGSDDDCDRPWRLWTQARVIRAVSGTKYRSTSMNYLPYPTDFPLRVTEKLRLTAFDYPDMATVEYVDMARLFESATTDALLSIVDPDWISYGSNVNRSLSPLLSVMPIERLVGRDGVTTSIFTGDKNTCFGYCKHVDQTILREAGLTVTEDFIR